jgi:hypothetical protein
MTRTAKKLGGSILEMVATMGRESIVNLTRVWQTRQHEEL